MMLMLKLGLEPPLLELVVVVVNPVIDVSMMCCRASWMDWGGRHQVDSIKGFKQHACFCLRAYLFLAVD